MKTFETEKHNIPEGATHYSEEQLGAYFCWYIISSDNAEIAVLDGVGFGLNWHACEHSEQFGDNVKPIPQINIETPEEKEALDLIDTTPHQYEMSKFSGNEWNGEGLPPVGVECEAVFIEHEHKGYGEFLVLGYHGNYVWLEYIGELPNKSKHYTAKIDLVKFRKPETPQQREERERDEKAKQIMIDACGDDVFKDRDWDYHKKFTHSAKIAFKLVDLGYRKESNQ